MLTKQGWETKQLREQLGLKKTGKKTEQVWNAHCVDAWCLAYAQVGGRTTPDNTRLLCVTPLRWHRRQLHRLEPAKGGKRQPYGGTLSLGLKRGTQPTDWLTSEGPWAGNSACTLSRAAIGSPRWRDWRTATSSSSSDGGRGSSQSPNGSFLTWDYHSLVVLYNERFCLGSLYWRKQSSVVMGQVKCSNHKTAGRRGGACAAQFLMKGA